MDAALAELSKTTTAIMAVRDLPAALEELRILEAKHAVAVDNRAAAEAALEAAEKQQSEAYSALDAQEMKMNATYDFMPNYEDASAVVDILADLIKRQQQAIAEVTAIVSEVAARVNATAAAAAKDCATQGERADNVATPELAAATILVAEGNSAAGAVASEPVANVAVGESTRALPAAILVAKRNNRVRLAVRSDIAKGWSWMNIPGEVLGSYTMTELYDKSLERTKYSANMFSDYSYKASWKLATTEALMLEAAFSLMSILYQNQQMTHKNMPDGYNSVFEYDFTQCFIRDWAVNIWFNDTHVALPLKSCDNGDFGEYKGEKKILIPRRTEFNIPIWIHPSFKVNS